MKFAQVFALFAVLAVTASACGDKNKHHHGDPHDSEVQVQEANNNGATFKDNSGQVLGLNDALHDGINIGSSKSSDVHVTQNQDLH
ncbi:hypothetical protein BDA99DRAFT_342646 [Phascolomyces articulosus]|uniref:Uncharacterized protein n=1 Tax=Phascolomyces articulosus TaxID=60185 RepID=A0AAD5K4M3_9FUNG|nr:hypothetical protein BDA99DRAFT_342646 [Phascolomyces articulosus]